MMFGGKSEHLHAAFLENVRPCVCVEARWVPRLVEAVVGLPVFKRHGEIGPGFRASMPNRIDAPVNPNAELHILEGFIGTHRGRMIFGDGRVLYVWIILQQRGWESMRLLRRLRQTGVDGGCSQCRSRCDKLPPIHVVSPAKVALLHIHACPLALDRNKHTPQLRQPVSSVNK